MLRLTSSYLNPRQPTDRHATINTISPIGMPVTLKINDDSRTLTTKRIELRHETDPIEKLKQNLTSPSQDILGIRSMLKTNTVPPKKNDGNTPPKQNLTSSTSSQVFKILDMRTETQSSELDSTGLRAKLKSRFTEANELRTMNQVSEQFKKLSREKSGNVPGSHLGQRLAIEDAKLSARKKNNNNIGNHLNNAIAASNGDFRKKEPPLNDIILKKLGLDPATKERQATHFVSNLEREFQNGLGIRKAGTVGLASKDEKGHLIRYWNVIPPSLIKADEDEGENEETDNFVRIQSDNALLSQGQGGTRALRASGQRGGVGSVQTVESETLSVELTSKKYPEYNDNLTRQSLSFQDIVFKEEPLINYMQTPKSQTSLGDLFPSKTCRDSDAYKNSSDFKKEQISDQSSKTLSEDDKAQLKQILSRVTQALSKSRAQEAALSQENQKLAEEILGLKSKLRAYEESRP